MFIPKASKLNWILLIGGSLLITIQAQASCHIHPADGDVEKTRSIASASGAVHKSSVCGLAITTTRGHLMMASGVLIYKPKEGEEGLAKIVTTAHDFYDQHHKRWEEIASVHATFSGKIDFDSPISASRIHIRDGFEIHASGTCRNDVALVEVPSALLPAECMPLEFYGGRGYTKPLIESLHAGYSRFCTTKTPYESSVFTRLYGGYTLATYSTLWDHKWFVTYLGSTYTTADAITAGPECMNHFDPTLTAEFRMGVEPRCATREDLTVSGLIQIYQAHPRQSLMGPGGSGSPLLFNTKSGLKVAGIYSSINVLSETVKFPGGQFCLAACYEPMMDHSTWVLNDHPDKPVTKRYVFY